LHKYGLQRVRVDDVRLVKNREEAFVLVNVDKWINQLWLLLDSDG